METNPTQTFGDLFNQSKKLIVPSYQRAYAWEEVQLNQFLSDLNEINDKEYYYGHFILEESDDGFEIIDGQQRITTFILFLLVFKALYKNNEYDRYIDSFQTVDYDQNNFNLIKDKISYQEKDWSMDYFGFGEETTLSIQRMITALNYFKRVFQQVNFEIVAGKYVQTLKNAHISTHKAKKDVAVQIFELQNTRGVKLTLIEKVKAKLMKVIYLKSDPTLSEEFIGRLQNIFGQVYQYEESILSNTFRGKLTLDEILLHHLRVVDDGHKIQANDKSLFNSPSKTGDREEKISKYLDEKLSSLDAVEYVMNLADKFLVSVRMVSHTLPNTDKANPLIGDVMILDKNLSLEFFMLLCHRDKMELTSHMDFIRLWEKFVYTRDFHDKYYRKWYRDDFELLFKELYETDVVEQILTKYVTKGFRPGKMDEDSLPKTVSNYVKYHKNDILTNGYFWMTEKMVYLLYKYEIEAKDADRKWLRFVMKEGRSVEHILPREWDWKWIKANDDDNISEADKEFNKEIDAIINGIGNLLLITGSENSSLQNSHPKEKVYYAEARGSYLEHEQNKKHWEDHNKWRNLIESRGQRIYAFLEKFIA